MTKHYDVMMEELKPWNFVTSVMHDKRIKIRTERTNE